MKKLSVQQIQAVDRLAIDVYGVPSLVLMENAGRCVAQEVLAFLKYKPRPSVCVVCGIGNNAGDGFVVARHLLNHNVKVKIYLVGKASHLKQDAAVNHSILKKSGYPIKEIQKVTPGFARDIQRCDCVVDAIFGVGLSREVKDPFKAVIDRVNQAARAVIAVDVPSGLNATTGEVAGTCIKAKKTVTFIFAKQGFYKKKGPACAGKVVVVDIGVPKKILDQYKR